MNALADRYYSVPQLRKSHSKTLLPPDSPLFNECLENYVRYVQGANAFIIVEPYSFFRHNLFSYMNSLRL